MDVYKKVLPLNPSKDAPSILTFEEKVPLLKGRGTEVLALMFHAAVLKACCIS